MCVCEYAIMNYNISHIVGNFRQFCHLLPLVKILSMNFFSCINNYTVDVATFTALSK